jgi:hypothetical protein
MASIAPCPCFDALNESAVLSDEEVFSVGVHHLIDQRMLAPEALLQKLDSRAHILHVHLMLPPYRAEHVEFDKVDERQTPAWLRRSDDWLGPAISASGWITAAVHPRTNCVLGNA